MSNEAELRDALSANEKAYRETMAQWRKAADERDLLRDQCDRLRGVVQRLADNLRRFHINGERDTALLHEARAVLAATEAQP